MYSITPVYNSSELKPSGSRRPGALKKLVRSDTEGTSHVSAQDVSLWRSEKSQGTLLRGSSWSLAAVSWVDKLRSRCRALCDSWRFCVLTTSLTIYALFGNDLQLALTHTTMDNLFNAMTLLCLSVFTLEIVAACLGKEGYFPGFFFFLDFGATATLFFDLTWVWNEFMCNSDGSDNSSGALKTSRAGRAGARAARTVRIIRLIRLVKLYKTYRTATDQRKERRGSIDAPGEEGDEAEEDEEDLLQEDEEHEKGGVSKEGKKQSSVAETRVGRKLSDMTTRRVIILVLVMLFVMPLFSPTNYGLEDFDYSANMGAELVYARLREWCISTESGGSGTVPWCLQDLSTPNDSQASDRYEGRAWFEEYLLDFIYNHIDGDFSWRLFWVGFKSDTLQSSTGSSSLLSSFAQLNQDRYLGPHAVDPSSIPSAWDAKHAQSTWEATIATMSDAVATRLTSPWIEECSDYFGVSVSKDSEDASTTLCTYDQELRCSELQAILPVTRTTTEEDRLSLMFIFDTRGNTNLAAGLSIIQTVFICLAVGVGSLLFSNDANQLLLKPIERMMSKMETIKDDPLYAMKMGDIEFRLEEIKQAKLKEQLANMNRCLRWFYMSYHNQKAKEPMETMILEKTIIKLGGLLALGFGEAGAEIIGHNMRGGHSAGVNAMIPGRKVDAIIGFANIRNFTDATETLKEKVMLFVNQIGEIVHGCVDDYYGAPNKNIGESFLLVWRLSGAAAEKQTKLADMAVASIIRMIAEVNKSHVLERYREHPGLQQRLPKYRVELGFGLHCGWAIEGAIGSEFKIDASYLSPNVNVASRLEAATKQFGVLTLISHFMVNLCSPQLASYCRLIDHVTVKGSKQPIRLFTIDLDYLQLKVNKRSKFIATKNRFKLRQLREAQRNEKFSDDYKVPQALATDEDVLLMRTTYAPEFFLRFSMAFRNYEAGEWLVARDMLYTCHYSPENSMDFPTVVEEEDWPVDGPTRTLLRFMRHTNFYPPPFWTGHRELMDK